ncbi:hypothetical protein CPC16_000082 [Podila verticillata]|nr:hypothetical protein BGZ59_010258 [Podila verticillata]KAF9396574.1 hypothetical protein CPC16_000082 [Podila verticillata]
MTAKPLDMSFDALSLRDSGLSSPVDQHHQYGQYQNNQNNRRFSQYGSERGPSSPLTRKPTNGSQRNSSGSVRSDGKDMKRQSSRMSLANVQWSPPSQPASPSIQSPMQGYAYQPMGNMQGPLLNQLQYSHHQQQYPQQQQQQPMNGAPEEPVDTIPTAIVIKNIPFSIKRDALLAILDNLDIPKPYAFNYHFDNGVFRGLAFANYRTSEETDLVVQTVNGLEVSGRKLRVEFKKVMPAAEQEKRDQEKAAAQAAALAQAQAQAAAEALLQRREMELMEQQQQLLLLEQERRDRERERELLQQQQDRRLNNRSSVAVLERRDSGRGLERDDSDSRYSSSASLNQLDLNDGETLAFYDRLLMFRGDSTKDDMIFPENLSGRQRRILHLIADKLSLYHFSEGEGNLRRLIIMKTPPPAHLQQSSNDISNPQRSPKQRPMSFAGRGSLRSESPVLKTRSPLGDHVTAGASSSSGSASPTRSLYRKSMVLAPEMTGNTIYPIRQPKGPEPGKVFTIRDQKQLRDATMIMPAFEIVRGEGGTSTRSFSPPQTPSSPNGSVTGGFGRSSFSSGRTLSMSSSTSLDVKAPSFRPAMV